MKNFYTHALLLWTFFLCATVVAQEKSHEYWISPVPFTEVQVETGFWKPRLDACRETTIPFSFKKCEETGRISNFAKAGGLEPGRFQGIYFDDSDLYKVIEGAAYVLALQKDEKLDAYLDEIIAKIAAAQEDDGYLYTIRTIYQKAAQKEGQAVPPGGEKRWSNTGGHELYCVGHLYEAAYAHYLATGKRNLLDVALKSADLICATFGVDKSQNWPPGHQEIEIGLAKLYRLTGEKKYLDTARYFLDIRGPHEGRTYPAYGGYSQDHLPVLEQKEAVGHAVRALYLYSGMADIAALTGDEEYLRAIRTIWDDVMERKLYVTGGLGARPHGEAFGDAYELPNDTAYCETCAQIAGIFWAHRMFLTSGESDFIDALEKILYNGMLSGVSMEGDRFFYPNVLEVHNRRERSPWFGCSCCPSNVCRFLASMPGYIYAVREDVVYVNLYTDSRVELDGVVDGKASKIVLEQKTDYPWDGAIVVTTQTPGTYTLKFRVPGWAKDEAAPGKEKLYTFLPGCATDSVQTAQENSAHSESLTEDGYITITKTWKVGDTVELYFPMPIRRVIADERVDATRGKVALQRGPMVFCMEQQDVPAQSLFALVLDDSAPIEATWEPDLLNGVVVLKGELEEYSMARSDNAQEAVATRKVKFQAIPYYAWAHREARQMCVWIARTPEAARPLSWMDSVEIRTPEFVQTPEIMKDGKIPTGPEDHQHARMHWWPKLGVALWMEYHFPTPTQVSGVEIYWFDDTGRGHCRTPESWKLLYQSENGDWLPVENPSEFGVKVNQFNVVTFKPVETKALRVEIQSQKDWAGGVYEWRVTRIQPEK
ncbi:MAG: glycoside hydrolase family 127 protein [Planctomycetia bacterium]|nr:glycoside hydrolase family 127 protein [Planctomycetia bacterium]